MSETTVPDVDFSNDGLNYPKNMEARGNSNLSKIKLFRSESFGRTGSELVKNS